VELPVRVFTTPLLDRASLLLLLLLKRAFDLYGEGGGEHTKAPRSICNNSFYPGNTMGATSNAV
jgi:hypothetical protein